MSPKKSQYIYLIFIQLIFCCVVANAEIPLHELLDKYESTINNFNLQASTIEHLYEVKEGSKQRFGRSLTKYRVNPEGLYDESSKWWPRLEGGLEGPFNPDNAVDKGKLWDGQNSYEYTGRPRYVALYEKKQPFTDSSGGSRLDGSFYGDQKHVITILRSAQTLNLRENKEDINGVSCFVLDANTSHGDYTLWFDPEHGYNIAKAKIHKEGGDMYKGKPLNSVPQNLSPKQLRTFPNAKDVSTTMDLTVENIKFEKYGEVWIPVGSEYEKVHKFKSGVTRVATGSFTRTEVDLDPDFEAMGAFVPDFPDGTRVFYMDNSITGAKYEWRKGKIIPYIDDLIKEQLEAITDELVNSKNVGAKASNSKVTALSLLAEYQNTQNKLRSFIAKGQSVIESNGKKTQTSSEFRYDGDRVNHSLYLKDNITPYKSFLWDGKSFIEYRQSRKQKNSSVSIKNSDSSKDMMIATEYKGAALMGFFDGDAKRIDLILSKAGKILLRETTEQIGRSSCYVIDATTKQSQYTLWIDTEHSFNIAQLEIQKGSSNKGSKFSLKNVQFKKINELWVPMEADIEQIRTGNGKTRTTKWHHNRTEMILSPDFEALKAFVSDDIQDGTRVSIAGRSGKYIWQDGKPVEEASDNVKF